MKMVLLTDVCDIQYGYPFDSSKFNDSQGMPLIRIRDVVRGFSETYTTEEVAKEYIITEGELLIGMDGEFNISRWGKKPALLNQRVCHLIPKKVDKGYLFYLMPSILKRIENKTSFVTVKHLSAKELNKVVIPLPELDVQQKISIILDKLDSLIARRREQLAGLDALVKARFVEMFGDPVSNPMGLPKTTLLEIGEFGRGVSKHRPRNDPDLLGGRYPLIQTGDVAEADLYIKKYTRTYSELGLAQSKMWKKGTLCITIAANIAKTAILNFDACFPDSVVGFIANENANNIYVHYWFSFFQKILEAQAPESAQKNINLKILSELEIVCPSRKAQDEFADFVSRVDRTRESVQAGLAELETLKRSLMQTYFG